MHVEKMFKSQASISSYDFAYLNVKADCINQIFLITECTNQSINHAMKGDSFNFGSQQIPSEVTPSVVYLTGLWVLGSLCSSCTAEAALYWF